MKDFINLPPGNDGDIPGEPSGSSFADRSRLAIQQLNPILAWAAIAGAITGLIGGCFQIFVSNIFTFRLHWIDEFRQSPAIGILMSITISAIMVYLGFWLMRRFAPDTGGSGIPQIEGHLDGLLPLHWQSVLPIKFLAGLFVLGSGMVMGREGPTIQMGGSIGKMVGEWFRANSEEFRILVAASAGAGLASAFNAPLAGILFVVEELRPEFSNPITAYRSVALAAIMSVIVLQVLIGQQPTLVVKIYDPPPLDSLWIFVLLGIGLGVIGYGFNRGLVASLNLFARQRGLSYTLIGFYLGGLVGLMAWLDPPTTGGGERMILWSLDTSKPFFVLLLLFAMRFGMTLLAYGSGAPGGIFAPLLSLSTLFSQAVGKIMYQWFPHILPDPGMLAIVGMGGIVAATVRAPLTAILLTVEMTGNYLLIVPLSIACLAAVITAQGLGGEPIYTVLLQRMLRQRGIRPLAKVINTGEEK